MAFTTIIVEFSFRYRQACSYRASGRKLKRFKRIALRCEKTERNYGSLVALACAFIFSVHTA